MEEHISVFIEIQGRKPETIEDIYWILRAQEINLMRYDLRFEPVQHTNRNKYPKPIFSMCEEIVH